LEKNYTEGMDKDEAIKLTIKSLLEVVQTGAKNIEITYVDGFNQVKVRSVPLRLS
jgi:20S proteasome subunit alpha 4